MEMLEMLESWPVLPALVVFIIVLFRWIFFEISRTSALQQESCAYRREYHEFLMMLIGEWGGYRLTPGIRINDDRMCAVLTTPKGWLLVKYDQEYEDMFKAVPVYQSGLVNVPLDERIQKELIAQLLKKSGEGMRYMPSYRQDVGLYQNDPIGPNTHDYWSDERSTTDRLQSGSTQAPSTEALITVTPGEWRTVCKPDDSSTGASASDGVKRS